MIVSNCPTCGREFKSEPEYAGKKFVCPKCDAECRIPDSPASPKSVAASPKIQQPIGTISTTAAPSDTETKMLHFKCPGCNKACKFKDEYAGRTFTCTDCGEECTVPTPKVSQPAQQPSSIAAANPVPAYTLPKPIPPKRPVKTSASPPEEPAEATAPQDDSDVLPAFAPTPNYGAKVLSVLKGAQSSIDGYAKTPRQGAEAPDVNHGLRSSTFAL